MPEINDIKTFASAKMNRGTHKSLLKNNEFSEIRNLRTNTSEDDNVGIGETILGNTLVANGSLPVDGVFKMHGFAVDGENHAIFYFVLDTYKDHNHAIYRYNTDDGTIDAIIIDSLLNFQEGYRITHANVIGDLLYWTDNYEDPDNPFLSGNQNQPRKINWRKAYNSRQKAYFGHIVQWDAASSYLFEDYILWEDKIYQARRDVYPGVSPTNDYYWLFIEIYNINNNYLNLTDEILKRIKNKPEDLPVLSSETTTSQETGATIIFREGFGDDRNVEFNNIKGTSLQFCYRWKYDDNEESKWSSFSKVPIARGETIGSGIFSLDYSANNVIGIDIDLGTIEVIRVDIAVRNGNDGNWRLVDRLYKYNEDGEINSDLESNTTYTWSFYNNKVGEPIDQDDVFNSFDYVPQVSGTQDIVEKNKIVDGNYVEGYDNVDIDIELEGIYEEVDIYESVVSLTVHPPGYYAAPYASNEWGVTIDEAVPNTLYAITVYRWNDNISAWGNFAGTIPETFYYFSVEGDTIDDIRYQLGLELSNAGYVCFYWQTPGSPYQDDVIVQRNVSGTYGWVVFAEASRIGSTALETSFKTGSWKEFGIVYFDATGRHGAVNTSNVSKVYIPHLNQLRLQDEISQYPIHTARLKWTIKHRPPEWASSYAWAMSKNPGDWNMSFIVNGQDIIDNPNENRIDVMFNRAINQAIEDYPQLNIKTYNWQKGDRLRFVAQRDNAGTSNKYTYVNAYFDFEVLGADYIGAENGDATYLTDDAVGAANEFIRDESGNKVRNPEELRFKIQQFEYEELLTFTSSYDYVVEVYRTSKDTSDGDTKFFYEFGEKFDILNPHTEIAAHQGGVDTGIHQDQTDTLDAWGKFNRGGSYTLSRISGSALFPVESVSFSDYYDSEFWDKGRANIINRNALRQRYDSNLRFSGTYIENTKINNLSSVQAEDYLALSGKFGPITKIDEVGYTLKVRQILKSTSIYVGRTGLTQAKSEGDETLLSGSDKTLGTDQPSRAKWGCSDPSSYVSTGTYSYFIDIINGEAIRDAANGMVPISQYGMEDWFKDKCKHLLEDCESYEILAGYDGYNNEIYFTFIGYLADDTHTIDTVVFNESVNGWVMFVDLGEDNDTVGPMDGFASFGNVFTSYLNGKLYVHNTNALTANFYGVQYNPALEFYANTGYNFVKNFKSISIDANNVWYAPNAGDISIEATSTYPRGMISLLKSGIFVDKEGVFYAPFGKNMVSNQADATLEDYVNGQDLRGHALKIRLINANVSGSEISGINIKSSVSRKSGIIK